MSNEPIETIEMPGDDEIQAFIEGGDEPNFHPILKVWSEVLKPVDEEKTAKVTPQWASRTVSSHTELTFADMVTYRDDYFGRIIELRDILEDEIASDADCLTYSTPEEDLEHNGHHYKNLLLNWQMAILQWELDWETTDPDAAVKLASISEVHKMFFGPTGVVAFLDNIKFELPEADQADMAAALTELKEGQ